MGNLKIGDVAVDFDLPGTDEKKYSLLSFKEAKALTIIFSCNHCPYVKAWEDRLISLQKRYAGNGVSFVLICANDSAKYPDDSFDNMKAHALEKNYPFPYLCDETQKVAKAYGAERTPEVFLFDSNRKLCYHGAPEH